MEEQGGFSKINFLQESYEKIIFFLKNDIIKLAVDNGNKMIFGAFDVWVSTKDPDFETEFYDTVEMFVQINLKKNK